MKKTILAAMLALTFTGGAFAAPSAFDKGHQVGDERRVEGSTGHDVKVDLKRNGVSMWMEDLAHAVPLTAFVNEEIWTLREMTPQALLNQRVQGDLQAYRLQRLAELSQDKHPSAKRAYALLSQITDDMGIKQWAQREVAALYIQALAFPRANSFGGRDVGNGWTFIQVNTYKQVFLPVAYRWSRLASDVGCAIKDAIEVRDAKLADLAGNFTEAFFTADPALFTLPNFSFRCQDREANCQPTKNDPNDLVVPLSGVWLHSSGKGIALADSRGVIFDHETVCNQAWSYSESTSAGKRKSKSHTIGDTTSSGSIVIHREKLRARSED